MNNVKFYRLSSLVPWRESYKGIFVHLTVDTVTYKPGLYFGGEFGWEYLTNDQSMITNAINGLDVAGYAQASIAATQGSGVSTITIKGIQEVDGKISEYSTSDTAILVDGEYDSDTNKIATQSTVTNAINGLDVDNITGMGAGKTIATLTETDGKIAATFQDISITASQISNGATAFEAKFTDGSHNVATMGVYTPETGETANYKLELFDGTQTKGALGADSSAAETVYFKSTPTASNPVVTSSDLSGIVGAMVYQGTVDGTHELPANPEKGWLYMVAADGTYANEKCETGDMIVYNGSSWDVINGENQVTDKGAVIVAGAGGASDIAIVDGTTITAKVSVTGGNATIASKDSNNVVTIKAGVTQTGTTGTIGNDSGTDITLNAVAVTGAATDLAVTEANYGGSTATTNAQTALNNLAAAITSASITIDGHKGSITTGDGLTDVAADGGSFGIKIDSTNANGLSVGANGIAMAKATDSSFGTVKVTAGNGLTLTDGVVAYAHNTDAITVASLGTGNDAGVVTIYGTLRPDASDAITTSNAITLAKVATTGAAADVSYAAADDVTGSELATVEDALDDLYSKVNTLQSTHTVVGGSNSVDVTSATSGNTTTYTVDLVWRENL